jgi:hypothetical protein
MPLHRYDRYAPTTCSTSPSSAPAKPQQAGSQLNKYTNRTDPCHSDATHASLYVSTAPCWDPLSNSATACQENAEATL